jgi:multiple sugar transport system substrate-binding protein
MRPPHLRLLVSMLGAALVLGACTPGGSDQGDGSGPVTLRITANAIKGGKNAVEAEWIESYVIPTFEQQMKDQGKEVDVQFSGAGVDDEDYKTKLALDLRSGSGPDVISIDGPWVGEFAQAGYIKPLAEVAGAEVDSWEGWQQIPGPVAGIMEFDGKRYGIPIGTDGRVLFYNKELFAKAGLPQDWQPASWDEILTTARELKAKLPGVTPLQINAGTSMGEATTSQGVLPLLFGTGKNVYDTNAGKWIGDTPELQAVLGFYRDVYRDGLGDAKLQQRADGRDRSFLDFSKGKIAVLAEGDYFWRSVVNPDGGIAPMADRDSAVGYALIPARQAGAGMNGQDFVSLSGGGGRVLNPGSKHPAEAWALLSFMNSRPAYEDWVKRQARLTPRSDVNSAALTDPLLKFVSEKVLPLTSTRPGLAAYPQVSEALQEAAESVAAGRADPAKAAKAYHDAVAKIAGADHVAGAGG